MESTITGTSFTRCGISSSSSNENVTREEFEKFPSVLLEGHTAILNVAWVPRVKREERVAHELAAARDGLALLHQIRELGVSIAMDDFGTGYSSLGYLRSFPFDRIKIDQSFIRDLSKDKDSLAILRAVVGLGRTLGIVTTAEGVETRDQLEVLRTEGCTDAQGYFFSWPQNAGDVRELLASLNGQAKAVA